MSSPVKAAAHGRCCGASPGNEHCHACKVPQLHRVPHTVPAGSSHPKHLRCHPPPLPAQAARLHGGRPRPAHRREQLSAAARACQQVVPQLVQGAVPGARGWSIQGRSRVRCARASRRAGPATQQKPPPRSAAPQHRPPARAPAPAHLWLMVFLMPLSISAYVSAKPSGSNIGSHPNWLSPRAGTMRPAVRPTNTTGSTPGPGAEARGASLGGGKQSVRAPARRPLAFGGWGFIQRPARAPHIWRAARRAARAGAAAARAAARYSARGLTRRTGRVREDALRVARLVLKPGCRRQGRGRGGSAALANAPAAAHTQRSTALRQ